MTQTEKSIKKTFTTQYWRLSNVSFWAKPNIRNNAYRKLSNLKVFWKLLALYAHQTLQKDFKVMQNVKDFWKRLGWVMSKTFFQQTTIDKIFGDHDLNQFEISLTFHNSLKSYALSPLTICEKFCIQTLLYSIIQFIFYLWWIKSVLKHSKLPKYYNQGCR